MRGDERAGDVLSELDDGDGHQAHVHRPVGDFRALVVAVAAESGIPPRVGDRKGESEAIE